MLRNFLKNRKAQNTAEYALLIALVVAGVIAMQTYAQRTRCKPVCMMHQGIWRSTDQYYWDLDAV